MRIHPRASPWLSAKADKEITGKMIDGKIMKSPASPHYSAVTFAATYLSSTLGSYYSTPRKKSKPKLTKTEHSAVSHQLSVNDVF
jgi:hypothetical protein